MNEHERAAFKLLCVQTIASRLGVLEDFEWPGDSIRAVDPQAANLLERFFDAHDEWFYYGKHFDSNQDSAKHSELALRASNVDARRKALIAHLDSVRPKT